MKKKRNTMENAMGCDKNKFLKKWGIVYLKSKAKDRELWERIRTLLA